MIYCDYELRQDNFPLHIYLFLPPEMKKPTLRILYMCLI